MAANTTPLHLIYPFQHRQLGSKKPKLPLYSPKLTTIPAPTLLDEPAIGWELEVEGYIKAHFSDELLNIPKYIYLDTVEDNSLKNHGIEFVTKGGLSGINLYNSLLEIAWVNENIKNGFLFSHRCSFHAHLDSAHFTYGQLKAFIMTFILIEPFLFSLCESHRKANSYCTPLNNLLIKQSGLDNIPFADTKYWSLSLNRLYDLGTLEIRMLHGTASISTLQQWLRILQNLWLYINQNDYETIKNAILNLRTTDNIRDLIAKEISPLLLNNTISNREIKTALFNAKLFTE